MAELLGRETEEKKGMGWFKYPVKHVTSVTAFVMGFPTFWAPGITRVTPPLSKPTSHEVVMSVTPLVTEGSESMFLLS